MEPGKPFALAGRQLQAMDLGAAAQLLADHVTKTVHALPRQCGDGNDVIAPGRLVYQRRSIVGDQQVDLVPDFEPARRLLRIEPERLEDLPDIGRLRLAI